MNSKQRLKKLETVVKILNELRESYDKTEELNELEELILRTSPFNALISNLKWDIRIGKNRSCPKCGSSDLFHQRRPNGNSECGECEWTGKTKECED